MKIHSKDLAVLEQAVRRAMSDNPTMASEYEVKGLSDKRLRWDLLRLSGLDVFGDGIGTHADLNLYAYLDDSHIDTALRHCVSKA